MSQGPQNLVLGYHGCDHEIAEQVFSGKAELLPSDNGWDWLGPGIYFWEGDEARARQWPSGAGSKGKTSQPAVIGAVINLGNCLDLTTLGGIQALELAYGSYRARQISTGKPLAQNRNPPSGKDMRDHPIRELDDAVIRELDTMLRNQRIGPYDTVRGAFREGEPIYPGAGFHDKTHIEIAVRDQNAIIGFFRPR